MNKRGTDLQVISVNNFIGFKNSITKVVIELNTNS